MHDKYIYIYSIEIPYIVCFMCSFYMFSSRWSCVGVFVWLVTLTVFF